MKILTSFLITVSFFCLIGKAHSDEVQFKNGERLIGKVIRMESGKIVFLSELAGEVDVDLEKVKSLSSNHLMRVHLNDGNIIKSSSITASETGITVKRSDDTKSLVLTPDAIQAINPRILPDVIWKGHVTAGYNTTNGNTYNEQANISINVVRRSKKTRLRFDGIYLAARDEDSDSGDKKTTEENFTLKSKYDYFFTRKMFAYLSGSIKKDHIADLDYRLITGSGLGYQWIDEEHMKFSTDAGLALLKEKYTSRVNDPTDNDEDEDGIFRQIKNVTRSDDLSLQLGYNYFWEPNQNTIVLSNMIYTPAVEDFSDYFLTFDAELRLAITKSFYSSFRFILDYDSEPGDDSGSTDTKYIIGLGWDFY